MRRPDLTSLGEAEADALKLMLNDGGWFKTLTAGKPTRAIVSPLSRWGRPELQGEVHVKGKVLEAEPRESLG